LKRKWIYSGIAAGALAASGLGAALPGASASPAGTDATGLGVHAVHACNPHPTGNRMSCTAMIMANAQGHALVSTKAHPLVGFGAADVEKAYSLTGLKSGGATVAIVDAFGYPTLESDLATFRKNNGLPACTTKSGCLTVMNQQGGSKPPPTNSGWDVEQALDLDMVSSACPDCKIVMVQANKNFNASLGIAEDRAAMQKGVVAISNSFGGKPRRNEKYFNHPGIAITASTGDGGYNTFALYPAADTHVIAVGGTSVFKDDSKRGYHETAWSGAGSGCSKQDKPAKYQSSVKTTCKTDATADVAGPADPNNGGLLIVLNGATEQVGGTSEASPFMAAVYALSGHHGGYPGKLPYRNTKYLYDITSGSNGACGAPLCDAGKGWDGPTGLGTPDGVKAF
jgi:subtilase family serine protease